MQEIIPTTLRKKLFQVLEQAAHSIPTRVRYKKGDAVILSYKQYERFLKKRDTKKQLPLVKGKIIKPLDEKAEEELLDYMGIR